MTLSSHHELRGSCVLGADDVWLNVHAYTQLALISEEVAANQQRLSSIVTHLADIVCVRAEKGMHHGE